MSTVGTIQELLSGSSSQLHFDDGTSVSAAELLDRGEELADKLSSHFEPGDRVALCLNPGLSYLTLLAAAGVGGFIAVNVNTRYSPAEVRDLVERSGSILLITDLEENRSQELGTICNTMTPLDLEALDVVGSPRNGYVASPGSHFTVFTTSGTTSKPKMVLHNQGAIVRHSREVVARFGLTELTPVLVALPMCGVFGLNSLFAAIAADSPVWVMSAFEAEAAGKLIAENDIVAMNGSDDMFNRLLGTDRDLSSIQIAGYGAFNTSLEDLARQAEIRGVRLSGLYGMSEVQALYAFADQSQPLPARAVAGGLVTSPDADVRVVDSESGEILNAGEVGELQLKGPSLFVGYLQEGGVDVDPVLTSASHDDGWFRTGDLGSLVSDGSFHFVARMGDVLRLGGFLVAPLEIEEVILELPEVVEAQVVSVSGPGGTRPVAFVIQDSEREPEQPARLETKVIDHCRSRLAKFKCPVRVISVVEFPATDGPNGLKIQRGKLREMAAQLVTL